MADLDVGDVVQIAVAAVVAGLALEPETKINKNNYITNCLHFFLCFSNLEKH